jgi:hypothetical protein
MATPLAIQQMDAGTDLVPVVPVKREQVGRVIGATGGVVASLLWGILLFGCVVMMIDPPTGIAGIVMIFVVPVSVLATGMFVVSVGAVVVLARRRDTDMPSRVAVVHLVLAALLAYGRHQWIAAFVLAAIGVSQLVAIRLQMRPSPR